MTPSNPPPHDPRHYLESRALLVLLIVVSLGFGWVLLPFYGTILWSAIMALLFSPLYRWWLPRLRRRRTVAALLTLLIMVVMVILPFALVTAALAQEAAGVYQRIQTGAWNPAVYLQGVFDALPRWLTVPLNSLGFTDFAALQRKLVLVLTQGSQLIAAQALSIGFDTFDFVARVFIMLYLAFFLIRDGDAVLRAVRRAIPLAAEHQRELAEKFVTVTRATVKGNLLVALIQGLLGGLAFWFLGVQSALLWAVLMAVLSLLPAVGAALVWAPVALYFFANGAVWQSVALVAWGVLVIGLVDNLLRPVLVGKETRMPDYLVMISTLGGLAVFGINGFVLGPVIAALFIAVWHIYAVEGDVNPPDAQ
ncbi:MAG: AI-2E family transporter [Pseudorhodobacter sp.]|nr:AI-2E family transporter [Rhizobacter sp.]